MPHILAYDLRSVEEFRLFEIVVETWGSRYSIDRRPTGIFLSWSVGIHNHDLEHEGSFWFADSPEMELWLMANAPPGYALRDSFTSPLSLE